MIIKTIKADILDAHVNMMTIFFSLKYSSSQQLPFHSYRYKYNTDIIIDSQVK